MGAALGLIVAIAALGIGVCLLVATVILGLSLRLWVRAKAAQVPLGITDIVMMRLRKVQPEEILENLISLWKAGARVSPGDLEAHLLAGGNLGAVTDAVIAAEKADLGVDFRIVAAIDLAGRDVVDAVRTRVNPKVLACPPPGAEVEAISGVARDGIRMAAKAKVTVRTRLDRLVGGAGEDTIVARVGEGIVAAIGGAPSHREILERPELISEYLLAKGLDSGTCFEILSVDIADVDVLDNIAARLQSSRAEADKRIARARAEVRRAAAVAAHREMQARTVEMEGLVTAAKATVPLAVSSAFVEANVGRHRPLAPTVNSRLRWKRA